QIPLCPSTPLSPYTTLFRSVVAAEVGASGGGEHLAEQDGFELLGCGGEALALAARHSSGAGADRARGDGDDHITTISARGSPRGDRKSTRLNSSHVKMSYAV